MIAKDERKFPMNRLTTKMIVHLLAGAMLLCLGACAKEAESLHEHTHDTPGHWPSGMRQAADFIEERLQQLTSDDQLDEEAESQVKEEILELIEWTPEIAADSELLEADWIPIYELSEAIRSHLGKTDVQATDIVADFEKLTAALRKAQDELDAEEAKEALEFE